MSDRTLPLQAMWVPVPDASGRVHMEQRWAAPAGATKPDQRPAAKQAA